MTMHAHFLSHILPRIAAALHCMAAAIERTSGKKHSNPIIAALAEQFPGAPEHWLSYIAFHAPHLAYTRSAGPGDFTDDANIPGGPPLQVISGASNDLSAPSSLPAAHGGRPRLRIIASGHAKPSNPEATPLHRPVA